MKNVKENRRMGIIIIAVFVFAVVAAAVLLGVFLPVHGNQNDGEYWSEYDEFDVSKLDTIEVEGDEFRILQLTDLHYHLPHKTKETDNIVTTLVEENDPDMIVITGDSVFNPSNVMYTKHVAELMDSFEIPWAIVYGNHDDEGKADKYWMGEVYENSQYGLYHNGPFNIGGVGNYAVNLTKDGQPYYSVIMMDSNRVTQINGVNEYGSFTPSQVLWYEWLQRGLIQAGYEHSLMFFHIPFEEYSLAYEEWEAGGFDESVGFGVKEEDVCCAPYNPGMFTKIKELGATTHTFAGHDHVNAYSVDYQGVRLTYGLKSSRQFYYSEELVGGTLITLKGDTDNVSVDIEYKYVQL